MAVINLLAERAPRARLERIEASVGDSDPYGIDIQLTLHICYELHYRGFAGVDAEWEWNPGLLHLRARLEDTFLTAVRREVGDIDTSAAAEMDRLSDDSAEGREPSHFLASQGSWEQLREYFVHRSICHLKEGGQHAGAIPRLTGPAKAAVAAAEFDEFSAGRSEQVHQRLFAKLMVAADLDPTYLAYIDMVPAESLAVVNLMSLFVLHRSYRGATVGLLAATEITSSPGSRRLLGALERMGAPLACREFYREHLEADAVQEQVVRSDVVGDLINQEPNLENDVVFGIRSFELLEERLGEYLMRAWRCGDSSLRRPLR